MTSSKRTPYTFACKPVLLLGALACSLGLQACHRASDESLQPVVTVQAEHPAIGDIYEHILADAILSPLAQAAISPKITAPIKAFYVQRGSKVKAGQLLAELENHDLTAQALDNKGQYTAAQASYAMQTGAQVPEESAKAEMDVAQARAQLHLQQEIVDARKKLFDEGAIAGRDYDTAVATLVQTQAAYDAANNHLLSLQKVSREATLQLAQGQLASAKGRYEAAEAQVSYSEIRSPISGVVTDRPLFPGETVASGSTLMTVMDTSALLAKVHLSQAVAQRLNVGDDASVLIPGVDEPVRAKVTLMSPALDPGSTTVEVWLRIDNKKGQYKAGTPVRVSIKGKMAPKAVKVPLSAILTAEDGSRFVMVVNADSTAHKVKVEIGIDDGEDVQIIQGLSGNEMVITAGAYGLDEGTKVKIGKPEPAGDEK